MGWFTSKKNDEELKKISDECLTTLKNFINSTTDENRLNMIFTRITIFRMKYDKKDTLFQNLMDRKKRELNLERNKLIVIQLEDIFSNIQNFDDTELNELNELMKSVLPPQIVNDKNGWNAFWKTVFDLFDKGAGKK